MILIHVDDILDTTAAVLELLGADIDIQEYYIRNNNTSFKYFQSSYDAVMVNRNNSILPKARHTNIIPILLSYIIERTQASGIIDVYLNIHPYEKCRALATLFNYIKAALEPNAKLHIINVKRSLNLYNDYEVVFDKFALEAIDESAILKKLTIQDPKPIIVLPTYINNVDVVRKNIEIQQLFKDVEQLYKPLVLLHYTDHTLWNFEVNVNSNDETQ